MDHHRQEAQAHQEGSIFSWGFLSNDQRLYKGHAGSVQ